MILLRLRHLVILVSLGLLISCNSRNHLNKKNYKLTVTHQGKKLQTGNEVALEVSSKFDFDSVQYSFVGKKLGTGQKDNPLTTELHSPLGQHALSALIFYKGDTIPISKDIVLYTDQKPIVYTYEIKNTYPHDPKAFTQGLEFYQDTLYEGTGMYGVSELRKVDLETGKVLQRVKLEREYFGEGITVLNNKVYQLTWREEKGFIYNAETFEKEGSFDYKKSKEGWGLCNDGQLLYKSDGTDKIWILDSETLKEKSYINPVTNSSLASKVNELEWVDGKIYANTWQKDGVLIIDPKTGTVEGVIDFRGLKSQQTNKDADVLNGIAYNSLSGKLYVTGKKWDKLFEVEIIEK